MGLTMLIELCNLLLINRLTLKAFYVNRLVQQRPGVSI